MARRFEFLSQGLALLFCPMFSLRLCENFEKKGKIAPAALFAFFSQEPAALIPIHK
jgi:hypothetical protein